MASQLLCNASCYERVATSNANADLKQPLVVVQDLESSQSSSSPEEEQNADIARQRVSNLIFAKSFCFGAFASLFLHAVTFSAFWVMCKKKWGKNPQPDESAPLPKWTLYLPLCMNIAFYALVWLGLLMMLTRKGSTYMRKKFDYDAHAPKSESVRTRRFLVILNGISFLIGVSSGSHGTWIILYLALGMPNPLLLGSLLVDVGLCCFMIKKCFDWCHEPSTADDEPEEDQHEEDLFFI